MTILYTYVSDSDVSLLVLRLLSLQDKLYLDWPFLCLFFNDTKAF